MAHPGARPHRHRQSTASPTAVLHPVRNRLVIECGELGRAAQRARQIKHLQDPITPCAVFKRSLQAAWTIKALDGRGRTGRNSVSMAAYGEISTAAVSDRSVPRQQPSESRQLRRADAAAVIADLRGDVEWTADGCEAAVFTAAARAPVRTGCGRQRWPANVVEAAAHHDLAHVVLASVVGTR